MHRIRTLGVSAVAAACFMQSHHVLAETPAQMEANKKVVIGYIHEVYNAEDASKIRNFLAETYVQHNPNFSGNRDVVIAALSKRFPKPKAAADIKLTQFDQVIAEGDVVATMLRVARPDPGAPGKTYYSYWFDFFRVRDGKIVEHWDSALKTSPGMSPRD